MQLNPHVYRYPSRRNVVFASRGMVATATPQAAQAGIDILKQGGNAIDAAVAAAACLTVVEPTANGIGGDAFALVWTGGRLHGLNASGPSARGISAEAVRAQGHREMPRFGWLPVTVPGAPAAWAALSRRFGRLPFSSLFAAAIDYAERGYAVGATTGLAWQTAWRLFQKELREDVYQHWFRHFSLENGHCPGPGDLWRSLDMAQSLSAISETGAEAFYRGELARKIIAFSHETGGYFCEADLGEFQPQWVEPIQTRYHGYDVWEIPPNGSGISVLMALNLLSGLKLPEQREDSEAYHLQIEAMKLAYTDTKKFVADPGCMEVTPEQLLSPSYAAERRRLIGSLAMEPAPGSPPAGGTVYLCTADSEGNMVSYIQSNYMGFGSGLVVPGTGIALQNRGKNFSLEPGHSNELAPSKLPYHTIIPGFLSRNGEAVGPFGVMGAFMQPQGHLQVVINMIDFHMNPQEALDAPRWQWMGGRQVDLERGVPPEIAERLKERGHQVQFVDDCVPMGRGQIIIRTDTGTLCGGTEPRADGSIAVW